MVCVQQSNVVSRWINIIRLEYHATMYFGFAIVTCKSQIWKTIQQTKYPMPDSKKIVSEDLIAKLSFLGLAAFVLFNYPIINLFTKEQFVLGVPALYLYFFSVWLALVIFIMRIVQGQMKRQQTNDE